MSRRSRRGRRRRRPTVAAAARRSLPPPGGPPVPHEGPPVPRAAWQRWRWFAPYAQHTEPRRQPRPPGGAEYVAYCASNCVGKSAESVGGGAARSTGRHARRRPTSALASRGPCECGWTVAGAICGGRVRGSDFCCWAEARFGVDSTGARRGVQPKSGDCLDARVFSDGREPTQGLATCEARGAELGGWFSTAARSASQLNCQQHISSCLFSVFFFLFKFFFFFFSLFPLFCRFFFFLFFPFFWNTRGGGPFSFLGKSLFSFFFEGVFGLFFMFLKFFLVSFLFLLLFVFFFFGKKSRDLWCLSARGAEGDVLLLSSRKRKN